MNAYVVLVDKPLRTRLLLRQRKRWEGNTKVGIRGVGFENESIMPSVGT
jgi:hypothetical protein